MADRHAPPTALRVLVGFVSLLLLLWGAFGIHLMLHRPQGAGPFIAFHIITEELLFAAGVFGAACLIWAVATPAWLERVFERTLHHLYVAMALGAAAVVILLVGVLLFVGLGLGDRR